MGTYPAQPARRRSLAICLVVIGRRSLVLVSERRIVAPDGARVVRVGCSDAGRGGRVPRIFDPVAARRYGCFRRAVVCA